MTEQQALRAIQRVCDSGKKQADIAANAADIEKQHFDLAKNLAIAPNAPETKAAYARLNSLLKATRQKQILLNWN